MKNLITYLALFIITLLFSPNNYWTLIYIGISFLICIAYLIFYRLHVKKEGKIKEKIFDGELSIILIMIAAINVIVKIECTNLLFGFTLASMFLVNLLKNIFNKTSWEKDMINPTYLFDYYSLLYMGSLFFMVLNHEV